MKQYNKVLDSFFGTYLKMLTKFLSNQEKRYMVDVLLKDAPTNTKLRNNFIVPAPISIGTYKILQQNLRRFVANRLIQQELQRHTILFDDYILGEEYEVYAKPFNTLFDSQDGEEVAEIRFILTSGQYVVVDLYRTPTIDQKLESLEDWVKMKIRVDWVNNNKSVIRTSMVRIIE
jgi:hypothetical protein